jgi:hypothetical protein
MGYFPKKIKIIIQKLEMNKPGLLAGFAGGGGNPPDPVKMLRPEV